ncbi:MFS transporter [Streptomyces sp. NPDC088354]|uniref:MFS transporter n=1 Tax=Streptomyces sp. NPDC088354 TaxID=3365856 RepID=UPI00381591FF
MRRPGTWGLLRVRDFRLLFGGSVVSGLGDWLDQVALLVLVTTVWHGGAGDLALVVSASMLPMLAGPFLAVLLDRRPSRRTLLVTDAVQAVLTFGLVFAPGTYWAAALVLARSTLGSAAGIAGQIQLRATVEQRDIPSATVLLQTATQSVKILGPALGGLLIALMSPRAIFAVNSCTFVFAVLCVWALRGTSQPSKEKGSRYLTELKQGFGHVFGTRILRSLLFVMCCLMFVVFLYDSMAALIVPALGMGPSYIGYMVSAVGVGGVVGSLLMGRIATRLRPFVTMAAAVSVIGCIIVFIGFSIARGIRIDPALWLCAIFLLGIASAGILVTFPSVVHSQTPVELTGRVWALMNSVPVLLNVLAPPLAALLVAGFGIGRLLLAAGTALLLVALVVAVRLGGVPRPTEPETTGASDGKAAGAEAGATQGTQTRTPAGPAIATAGGRAGTTTHQDRHDRGGDPLALATGPGRTTGSAPLDSGATRRDPAVPRDRRAGSSKEDTTMSEKIDKLAAAGFVVAQATEAQQEVLKSLSDEEIGVLLSVKSRVEAAGADVEGHVVSDPSGGYLW